MNNVEDKLPFVSVIMPLRNEEKFIGTSLSAVLKQNYPADRMEVVVADGKSSDNTVKTIENLARFSGVSVRTIENPKRTAAAGLNVALQNSRGEIIVRVDGHTVIEPDYISQCVALLRKTGASNVGGRMDAFAENRFGKAVSLATSSPFGIGNARFHYSQIEEEVDTVYMGAWRREVFERNGLFNEELVRNQDDEFNYRLRANGGVILLSPKIRSLYFNRSSIRSLWRQYFQYGFWKVRVMQIHPRQMAARQFVPAIFVTAVIVGGILAAFSTIGSYLLIFVSAAYFLASLSASFKVAARGNLSLTPIVLVCFFILHFSYGTGFLTGLFYFWNRWREKTGHKLLVVQ